MNESSWAAVVLIDGGWGANDAVGGAGSRICGLSRCGYDRGPA